MTKKEIREEVRGRKKGCAAEKRAQLSKEVVANLVSTELWKNAHRVLLYYSLPDEVATHELVSEALREGKAVLLPRVVGDDLELRLFSSPEALVEGAFHIQEPTGSVFTDYETIDLAIIPGVAFTTDGKRLGRGRGYYDRLLPRLSQTYKIGICWPFQVISELPSESHDINMDCIITC